MGTKQRDNMAMALRHGNEKEELERRCGELTMALALIRGKQQQQQHHQHQHQQHQHHHQQQQQQHLRKQQPSPSSSSSTSSSSAALPFFLYEAKHHHRTDEEVAFMAKNTTMQATGKRKCNICNKLFLSVLAYSFLLQMLHLRFPVACMIVFFAMNATSSSVW